MVFSFVFRFKFLHETNQCLNTFHWHGIVYACPHASDTSMTLQVNKPFCRCLLDELRVQIFIPCDKWDIHRERSFWPPSFKHVELSRKSSIWLPYSVDLLNGGYHPFSLTLVYKTQINTVTRRYTGTGSQHVSCI